MRRSWGMAPLPGLFFVLPALGLLLPFLRQVDSFGIVTWWSGIDLTVGGWAHASMTRDGQTRPLTVEQLYEIYYGFSSTKMSVLFLKAQPVAILAVLLILAGFLTILLPRQRFLIGALAGLGGALFFGLATWVALSDLAMPAVVPAYGFWLTMGALVVLGLGCAERVPSPFTRSGRSSGDNASPATPVPSRSAPPPPP